MTNPENDRNYKPDNFKNDFKNDDDNTGLWIGGLVAVVVLVGAIYFSSARNNTSDYNYSPPAATGTDNTGTAR
jgi:hypothetical protein